MEDEFFDEPDIEFIPQVKPQQNAANSIEAQFNAVKERDLIDFKMGFNSFVEGPPRLGWIINIQPTLVDDGVCSHGRSGVEVYMLQDDGERFKATILYEPYFFVMCKPNTEIEVEEYIKKRFRALLSSTSIVSKEDLSLPNHLLGNNRKLLKLSFHNESHHLNVRRSLASLVEKNAKKQGFDNEQVNYDFFGDFSKSKRAFQDDPANCILELREYDITYYSRVQIDKDIRVGVWYNVKLNQGVASFQREIEKSIRPDPVVLAFDIETTKLPLKFPDVNIDSIMMISYMIDGQGYLITNREIISKDIEDFEFTPKPEFKGNFIVFNEINEKALIERFFEHIVIVQPNIISTYNGDFFDWPFLEGRANTYGIDMKQEIGFFRNQSGEYLSSSAIHLDCFCWVKRDSYLPQGSQGLKAVAKEKLGYDPVELDPEDMTRFAADKPQVLSQYSVSDAVATYYLYMKYVHPFIFSLCNIIPLNPDDVLRRGSGTLCEHLLMVEAFKARVIMPNKHSDSKETFFEGHLLSSETYVGGHVEALEAGVFRNDLPIRFKLSTDALQTLIDEVDQALKFTLEMEMTVQLDEVSNYEEIKGEIVEKLEKLKETPIILETPAIYHLDVAAMYPNIILTNRLQPDAVIDEDVCASCDFNEGPDSLCQRTMPWSWRGEFYKCSKGEYNMLMNQLEQERFPGKTSNDPKLSFHELPRADRNAIVKKRISEYSRGAYGKIHDTRIVEKTSIVCQRENPFYIDTVANFRDRRYEYKQALKTWKGKLSAATAEGDATAIDDAQRHVILYDSLQLAHKCILNSFYGYVMRKGARWYSMEMAGIVCLTGAKIIQLARTRVEQVGRPLELDTDGIWCMLPSSFPDVFKFKLNNGKSIPFHYPCVMLNHLVHDQFTNHQYQVLDKATNSYTVRKENSIFFEVDGPYRAMILPSSTEEDKLLKKRYAVFDHDGSLAELKGFEIKRRGELKLIKHFQGSIFKVFLDGNTLEECYAAVAKVCNRWLDILYTKGADLSDEELFDLISENRSMSKSLEAYGAQKSTSISTAKRLAEFLGDQMVRDRGLNCRFIIASKPIDLPVSERAIPVAIFQSDPGVKRHYLRKWLKDNSLQDIDLRDVIDWKYYLDRFGSVIQKLITIPAALQGVENPVPRVRHPDWLAKRLLNRDDKSRQYRITDMLKFVEKVPVDENEVSTAPNPTPDIEDFGRPVENLGGKRRMGTMSTKVAKKRSKKLKRKYPVPEGISPYDDFTAWVEQQNLKWKEMYRKRSLLNSGKTGGAGIKSFFSSTVANVTQNLWQLLHIAETDAPGVFRIWAIVNGVLESLMFEVPRTLFLNCRIANGMEIMTNPNVKIQKRSRILPRNRPTLHLYELEMSETYYKSHSRLFSTIFNSKEVEGVYEGQVPLVLRALLKLGCFAQLRSFDTIIDKNALLSIDDLIKPTQKILMNDYLPTGSFKVVHLFRVKSGSRQFWAIFNKSQESAHIVVVDPGMNSDAIPPFKKIYSESLESVLEDENEESFDYPSHVDFKNQLHSNEKDAIKAINSILQGIKDEGNSAIILGVQSAGGKQHLRSIGCLAIRDFPCMDIPLRKNDSVFPAIGWQLGCAKKAMISFLFLDKFLENRIDHCRYANVPICNLENDYPLFLADLFLARQLKESDMVLWCSPSSKPDLGGSEQDDFITLGDLRFPEVDSSGTYDKICVEFDLCDLTLNTLIFALTQQADSEMSFNSKATNVHLINSNVTNDDQIGNDVIQRVLSGAVNGTDDSLHHTFAIMKKLIKLWLGQVQHQSIIAASFLEHFHRWISSSSSLHFDPMIVSHTHELTKRCFAQLLEEFRRLGSQIIHASFDKLVIMTSKTNLKAAVGYISYLIAALKKKPQFQHLELKPVRYWSYLMWFDQYNEGGIRYFDEDSEESGLDVHWNIADYLPPFVREIFLQIIAVYLGQVQKINATEPNNLNERLAEVLDSEIKSELFDIVVQIQREHFATHPQENVDPNMTFPNLPGGGVKPLKNASLEFVKMVCGILELNKGLHRSVRILRKGLLKLIGVKEFSSEANFSNPCQKFVLSQVVCEFCNHSSNLDLTRSKDMDDESFENTMECDDSDINSSKFLVCPSCFEEYDRVDIEQRLIETVQKTICKWQLQDLKCSACRLIKAEDLRETCASCKSANKTVLDYQDTIDQIHVIKKLANFFGMETLAEVVSFSLST